MIQERPRGVLGRFMGLKSEVTVPEVLDHVIHQPESVEIHLKGPKDDCLVVCKTPSREFSFNDYAPEAHFMVDESVGSFGYKYNETPPKIQIPARDLNQMTTLLLFHELGHHMSFKKDEEWGKRIRRETDFLRSGPKIILLAIFWLGKFNPRYIPLPGLRQKMMNAYNILGEAERKGWAYALWEIRQLRKAGIDPVPDLNNKQLREVVNSTLRRDERFGFSYVKKKESFVRRVFRRISTYLPS